MKEFKEKANLKEMGEDISIIPEIREMRTEDIEKVYEIEKESFADKWNIGSFFYSIKANSDYCIVAENEGKVVGFAIIRSSFDVADVANVAVALEFRRRGIGEKLMKHMIDYGSKHGIADFVLEVRKSNFPAISLYKKMGFKIENLRKEYYSNPKEDALIMWRRGQIYA